ncbi:MAG: 50S ribosomal protein L21e [Candidatus Parvarchaeota archaeon]|nr:50S ribosomal protein L21e [Candidatus Jingweiarchaeum tengchongense]MCW1298232.1 50S ribosomal protein L21e [Candidatus Jingweiarchaeum tengchongense]MCW1300030.1 50S ribosomal protein L21e [Candidatus Jingweiarchaeum tengchongense]MCW1304831.1 50S ribosomal protein L21e [Candidatus Jingweiarchaeum tengchongense]MCW1305421.1 50S ribosomal protein L21e [Candidatus Jingweiarchaeum tengchongense]
MVIKSKGPRSKTRQKFKKEKLGAGKVPISRFLQSFNVGEKVIISPEVSFHKGMPNKRFYGKIGKVIGRRGKAFLVEVEDGNKKKIVICPAVHLKKLR